ncbi:hypothetical protein QUF74_17350 [Candidatus Halobeggiatoa sp. HSG11]|nr:hypothetical protein [Candidatus Halobeggiatoa sp. HSG11]
MKKQLIELFFLSNLFCFVMVSLSTKADTTLFLDDFGEPITGKIKQEWFEKGEDHVINAPAKHGLYTKIDSDKFFKNGRDEVLNNLKKYDLYTERNISDFATINIENGKKEVLNNPQKYELFDKNELESAIEEEKEFVIGRCQRNPTSCGIAVDGEVVSLTGGDHIYYVGDKIDISMNVLIDRHHYKQVDLWVIVELPDGSFFYMTENILNPFVSVPTSFRKSIQQVEDSYQIIKYEVPQGIGGDYSVYAFFNEEGSGLEHFFSTIRSNIANIDFIISNNNK